MFACTALTIVDYNDNDNLRLSQFLHLPFDSYIVNRINNCIFEIIVKVESNVSFKEVILKELSKNMFTNENEIDCLEIGEFIFHTITCNGYLNKHYYDVFYGEFNFEKYMYRKGTNYIPILNTSFKKYEDIHYIGDIYTHKNYIDLLNYIKDTDCLTSDIFRFTVPITDLFDRQEKYKNDIFSNSLNIEKNKINHSKKKNRKVFIFE